MAVWLICALSLPAMAAGTAAADRTTAAAEVDVAALTNAPARIDATADRLEYDRRRGVVEATGHACIRKGTNELHADFIRVDLATEEAHAEGNVVLRHGGQTWTFDTLDYNFRTKVGGAENVSTEHIEPFQLRADKTERLSDEVYVLHGAEVTTCTNDQSHWHYHLKAREVTIRSEKRVTGKRGVWYFGRVPVMYVPYWFRDLEDEFGFTLVPGHDSRMGAFLLTSYGYRINETLKAETHLDLRTRRGVALGQDLEWRTARGGGKAVTYYADDLEPVDHDEDVETADIDRERYRIFLQQSYGLTPNDYMLAQLDFVSDTDVREDFFEREHRRASTPENYFSYSHRAERYTSGFVVGGRVNDFYATVNRVPEVFAGFASQPVASSGFYYEGQSTASFLERTWAEDDTANDDYSLFRLDSEHMAYRPSKHFGFLNLVPRAGLRGTYYSKTRETIAVPETVTRAWTNSVVDASGTTNVTITTRVTTNEVPTDFGRDAALRVRGELGLEASFKAFRTWSSHGMDQRHVVEPYVNYRFVPEPSLPPEEIYQFDEVDELTEEHWIDLGVRNKLQVKREGGPFDILDVDLWARVQMEPEDVKEIIRDVNVDAEIRPGRNVRIDLNSSFDVPDGELDEFNTLVRFPGIGPFSVGGEYRHRRDDSSLLAGDIAVRPNFNWQFNLYGRYEFEEERFEEEWVYVQRNFDCMSLKSGLGHRPGYTRDDGSDKDEEWRFVIEFWLTAFPKTSFGSKGQWD